MNGFAREVAAPHGVPADPAHTPLGHPHTLQKRPTHCPPCSPPWSVLLWLGLCSLSSRARMRRPRLSVSRRPLRSRRTPPRPRNQFPCQPLTSHPPCPGLTTFLPRLQHTTGNIQALSDTVHLHLEHQPKSSRIRRHNTIHLLRLPPPTPPGQSQYSDTL